jgi:cell division protein FtsN
MKLIGAISTAVLSLSLGIGIPAYAQQDQHDQQEENKDKPAQENEKKAQPEKPAKQEAAKPEAAKPEEKNNKPEERTAQAQAKPEQNAQHAPAGRIPADRYKANFGREHSFRVSQADYSNHRFQYGGYSFGFVDAWPSNWLYTQDVYVVEINGVYYLCNASYPGVNLALSIQL